ncbi:MAG: ABC transporter permease [Planctomycetes bacterium]|nr:ABC transporter permease [Planctomycetota bacterium]
MLDQALLLVYLTILSSVPYLLPALGGTCSERAGVVNIGLEGMLLVGAFAAAAAAHATGSAWTGLVAGVLAGTLTALLHALLTVTAKVDQIISGLSINLLAGGATGYGMDLIWGDTDSGTVPVLPAWELVPEGPWGNVVNALFGRPLVLLTALAVPAVWLLLFRTRFGLRLSAVGENPAACDTLGLSVAGLRYRGVLLSGALAGMGGSWLAFNVGRFGQDISAGKGYIAMAAVVCGRWRPLGVAAACFLFGFAGALCAALERWRVPVPSQLLTALPYVLTMIVVAGLVGRARAPAALGVPYEK